MILKFSLLTFIGILIISNLHAQLTLVQNFQGIGPGGTSSGLNQARSVLVSPDDKHVYVGAGWGDAVPAWNLDGLSAYSINAADGSLTLVEIEYANGAGEGDQEMDDLFDLAMDCNGQNLYVVEENDNQITWFDRNAATGALTYRNQLATGDLQTRVVRVHPSGNYVAVGGRTNLTIYDRDGAGDLTLNSTVVSGVIPGIPTCASPYMRYNEGMEFSPNGNFLYVCGSATENRSVDVFSFDDATGTATWQEGHRSILATCTGATVDMAPQDLTMTKCGDYMFVAGGNSENIVKFAVDTVTGSLSADVSTAAPASSGFVEEVFMAPHGDQLFVSKGDPTLADNKLIIYDHSAGVLTYNTAYTHSVGVMDIDQIQAIASTSDSKYIYAVSYDSDGLTVWDNTTKSVSPVGSCVNPNQAALCPIVLGVELTEFSAKRKSENSVQLNWSTQSENNNAHFVIERSVDGHSYKSIGTVEGAGSSSVLHYYTFEDNEPLYSASYYRLKQVDFDFSHAYSGARFVPFGESCDYLIYADRDNAKIKVQSGVCDLTGEVTMEVFDASGRRVLNKLEKSRSEMFEVGTQGLPKGIYYVNVRNGINSYKQKIVIQ